ncbi:M48 family metalloprotease [Sulfuracidifex tepidarius]|uniref:M48 family metalloprotease n=1 Tax=Sulfuracidifex tepidarius TaxID=1294262 RepID=UPI0034E2C407
MYKAHELCHAKEHHALINLILQTLNLSITLSTIHFLIIAMFPNLSNITISLPLVAKLVLITIISYFLSISLIRIEESKADAFAFNTVARRPMRNS